jgi:hypothetical protein
VVTPAPDDDPVLRQRARMARLATTGMRIGYTCLAVAVVAFVVAFSTHLAGWAVATTIAGLIGAAIALPPSIVLDYGVKKAQREEP